MFDVVCCGVINVEEYFSQKSAHTSVCVYMSSWYVHVYVEIYVSTLQKIKHCLVCFSLFLLVADVSGQGLEAALVRADVPPDSISTLWL